MLGWDGSDARSRHATPRTARGPPGAERTSGPDGRTEAGRPVPEWVITGHGAPGRVRSPCDQAALTAVGDTDDDREDGLITRTPAPTGA
jgi:hypothetical protein